jgi:hypothetical protein
LLKSIISEQIKHFPWLMRHMANHYIATHPDGQRFGTVVVTNSNNETVVSGLTYSSPVARAMRAGAVVTEPRLQQTPPPTDVSITATDATDLTSKRGGRPQGSTLGEINARKILVVEVLCEGSVEIASLKYTAAANSDRLGKKCRVPIGSYEKAIGKFCKKCDLERSELSMETALSRTNAGRKLKVKHRGTHSPMIGMEAHLLAAILRRAELHQPVTC